MIFGIYVSAFCIVIWFIFQRRELKRFYEKSVAEENERKAVEKEVELTNVLNLQ